MDRPDLAISGWAYSHGGEVQEKVEYLLDYIAFQEAENKALRDAESSSPGMDDALKDKILFWVFTRRVGESSKAMACAAVGIESGVAYSSHPHDPDDLHRCLLLLQFAPNIRERFDKIASISDVWRTLITNWDELERTFIHEVGLDLCKGRSAPKTYDLMKRLGC